MTVDRDYFKRNVVLLFVGALLAYVAIGFILWWVLNQHIDPQGSSQQKDLFQALGLIMAGLAGTFAGLAAIVGVYVAWKNLKQTGSDAEKNLMLATRGQVTERFTRAVDQLGNDATEVCIGGIYALERIAEESDEHYWSIIEILTAYIRTNSRASQERISPRRDPTHQHRNASVQAALYVLARRNYRSDPGEEKFINLSETDLRNADLRGASLRKARLRGANLDGAILRGVDFGEANLRRANLRNTKLERASFKKAKLHYANLQEADLEGADFSEADLRDAELTGATDISTQELGKAKDLKGTIMPDGSKHP